MRIRSLVAFGVSSRSLGSPLPRWAAWRWGPRRWTHAPAGGGHWGHNRAHGRLRRDDGQHARPTDRES